MRNRLRLLVGLWGVVELLAPRAVIDVATRVSYRGTENTEPREWVFTATRIHGAVLTVVALVGLYEAASADDETEAEVVVE